MPTPRSLFISPDGLNKLNLTVTAIAKQSGAIATTHG
jgi:hypothetical protein